MIRWTHLATDLIALAAIFGIAWGALVIGHGLEGIEIVPAELRAEATR